MNSFTKIAIGVMALVLVCGCETAAASANATATDADSSAETHNQSALAALHGVGLPKPATDTTELSASQDADNDHFNVEIDCNDQNPDVHPGAFEFCDYIDNNCNGAVDENWKTVFDGAYGQPCSSLGTNGCWSEGIWACDFTRKW